MKTGTKDSLTAKMGAVADPARRRILALLKEQGCCSLDRKTGLFACDVEQRMQLSQPTISHHMQVLTRAELVQAEKHGRWRWYRRNEEALRRLLNALKDSLYNFFAVTY